MNLSCRDPLGRSTQTIINPAWLEKNSPHADKARPAAPISPPPSSPLKPYRPLKILAVTPAGAKRGPAEMS